MIELDPHDTPRATAFELWRNAPMPMVTLFKTLNVSRLIRLSRRKHMKFNMLMCYCVGRSAHSIWEIDGIVNQYSGIFNNPFLA